MNTDAKILEKQISKLNKLVGEKRQIFCAEELQFMHSAYEEMHHSSLLLECRLRTVASFQNAQYGTDLTNTTSASNQRQHPVISHADSIHLDMM